MTTFLDDLNSSIAVGDVRVVSDAEHKASWQARHWKQQQQDVRAAQRFALEYGTDQLLTLIDLIERSQSPHRETVKRQYLMALDLKRRGRK